ncbi:tobamovirus multiplication protein 1-like isoform x1 [Anaeramoeba flamelloides]|uniref:Tobamovirus multiplication protein 1-like isoform x1 n=1 Tax=Anaeramoeba flamelloides TaxID=1746091 RepID=A0ABQ8XXH6_9EUKA|nr:tobamovirus multiplication protein 1-like isoform x1 [Anaeramoeba flamelloides]
MAIARYVFGIVVCVLIFLWALYQLVVIVKRSNKKIPTSQQFVFHALVLVFLLFRIIWLGLKEDEEVHGKHVVGLFVINRFAIVSFFTSFTLLIFYWAEIFHGWVKSNEQRSLSTLKKPFWLMNGFLYLFSLICIIVYAAEEPEDRETNDFYTANILIIALLSALVSIGFLFYGFSLIKRFKDSFSVSKKKNSLRKIVAITIIFFICFMLRFIFFLYRPATDKKMNPDVYTFFAYYIPELIPTCIQLYTMKPKKTIKIDNEEKSQSEEEFDVD